MNDLQVESKFSKKRKDKEFNQLEIDEMGPNLYLLNDDDLTFEAIAMGKLVVKKDYNRILSLRRQQMDKKDIRKIALSDEISDIS